MILFHLATQYEYSGSGIPERVPYDYADIPTVIVYSDAGLPIESPTMSKYTNYYANGHYNFTLNSLLYVLGDTYYFIVTGIDDEGDTIISQPEYFTWGFITAPEGDASLGYNRNLFKCIKSGIETYLELMALCPTILRSYSSLTEDSTFPVLVVSFLPQTKIPGMNPNLANLRRTFIRFIFYHSELKDKLLMQLNDLLNTFLLQSDNYEGYKFKDSLDVFHTFEMFVDVMTEDEPPVVWDDEIKLWRISSRYVHDGRCRTS